MGDSKTSLSNPKITQHDKLEREWRSFQKEMWNPFIDRVDADLETLNGRSNRHRELLDNNLKWQHQAEELAGRHEQRISELERNLEEKEVYISNIVRIRSHNSNTTWNSGEFPRYVYLLVIRFPETPDSDVFCY